MKSITDEKTKTIWYYSESGYPTYMAIDVIEEKSILYTFHSKQRNLGEIN